MVKVLVYHEFCQLYFFGYIFSSFYVHFNNGHATEPKCPRFDTQCRQEPIESMQHTCSLNPRNRKFCVNSSHRWPGENFPPNLRRARWIAASFRATLSAVVATYGHMQGSVVRALMGLVTLGIQCKH